MKRGSPLRRVTPLRSGSTELKRTKLNPVSKKRKKRMQAQAKERAERGEPTRHPGPCEVTHLLSGVVAWEQWKECYLAGMPWAEGVFHRHHVFGQKAENDQPWNVVVVSEVAHEWEDKCWQTAGMVVCMTALFDRGHWNHDEEFYRSRLGYYPLGKLENWTNGRIFDGEPVLLQYAYRLLHECGRELWRPVIGYEGLYEVSTRGRVRSVKDSRRGHKAGLKKSRHTRGYPLVTLYRDKVCKNFCVHRLVAEAFIPNPDGKPEVNHRDGIKANNAVVNLEWLTTSENQQHSYDVLGRVGPRGEVCGLSKLTEQDVRDIRAARATGETTRSIGDRYGIGNSQVSRIARRQQWGHIT